MSTGAQQVLETFSRLSDGEQREVAAEIVRRTLHLDESPLSDDDLTRLADDVFLELDRQEAT